MKFELSVTVRPDFDLKAGEAEFRKLMESKIKRPFSLTFASETGKFGVELIVPGVVLGEKDRRHTTTEFSNLMLGVFEAIFTK